MAFHMKIGVIGYGYWGPNLLRNLAETPAAEVTWCSDIRADRRALAKRRYPTLQVTPEVEDLFRDRELDAVAIATPVNTHFALAKRALEQGKHVLIEKPMTATVEESEELVALAAQKGLVLMVDHTFVYTGAVRKIKELLDAGTIGHLYYFDSVRVNLGLFQHDIDVLWDLAPHDLSILTHLVPSTPRLVSAHTVDHTGTGLADLAYMTVHYDNAFIAHFHVNWLSPVKVRQILIGGSKKMLLFDDMEPSEKVRVYDRGVAISSQEGLYKTLIDYRTGDMWSPRLEQREALSVECEHFTECVRLEKMPWSSGEAGLAVVKLLSAASRSAAADGKKVEV
jgi:predicted dehydrogenase